MIGQVLFWGKGLTYGQFENVTFFKVLRNIVFLICAFPPTKVQLRNGFNVRIVDALLMNLYKRPNLLVQMPVLSYLTEWWPNSSFSYLLSPPCVHFLEC